MRTTLLLLLLVPLQETKPEARVDLKKGADSITEDDLKKHATILAGDEYEGRNAGYPGNVKAGDYIAEHFKACGLKPCGDKGTWFQNFEFPVRYFDPRSKPATQEMAKTRNVVGLLEGSDAKLKSEYVVVGAHYDHVGKVGQSDAGRDPRQGDKSDVIWNGADDNGSGTVALLEIAQALKEAGLKPKRSLLLIAFSAEEHGLFGSYWYCDHPIFPLDKTHLMINLDMIGRNDDKPVTTHGVGTAKDGVLRKVVEGVVKETGLNAALVDEGDIKKEDSDHYPFYKKSVPSMFFFTGLHADYHTRADHAEKLAYPNIAKIARSTLLVVADALDRKDRFVFNGPRPLGVKLQDLSGADARRLKLPDTQGGVTVTEVSPKSVAEAAGIKKGDVIVQAGETVLPRRNPQSALDAELAKVEDNKPLRLLILRNGGRVEAKAVWK